MKSIQPSLVIRRTTVRRLNAYCFTYALDDFDTHSLNCSLTMCPATTETNNMFRYIKTPMIALFKIIKKWITRQSPDDSDLSIISMMPFNINYVDDDLYVDSLMQLQDLLFDKILPNQKFKKLKRSHVEILNHIINIKVSDLINRMNNNSELNSTIRSAKMLFPRIKIDGRHLISWFINIMDINPDEAQYMANLLSSHIIIFTIVNYYLTLLDIGCFNRKLSSMSQTTSKTHLNDYYYAVYLCKREIDGSLNGNLFNYTVNKSAKAKVDLNKWEFEFEQTDENIIIHKT